MVRLRRDFPTAEIGWVVGDLAAPLLEGHPAITRLHVVDRRPMRAGVVPAWRELRRVGAELEAQRYDVAIDVHTRLKSGYLAWASRAPLRIGVDRRSGTEANFLFTNCHVNIQDHYENRVTRFARVVAALGGALGGEPAALTSEEIRPWVQDSAAAWARDFYEQAGRPQVALFPGTSASRARDRWPLERWRAAAGRLSEAGHTSMVLWGPGEMDVAGALAADLPGCSLAPATTLPQMLALLGRFRLYLGSNTAALHMAWMQGVPSVVLVGGRPWRTDQPLPPVPSRMLSTAGAEPSRRLRGDAASRAIEGVEVDDVVEAAESLLRWSAAPD